MRIQAKTPAIAHYLLEQNIIPVFPYTRPKGVKGNLRPNDFVYDAFYDCYLCPDNQVLTYRTTTRDGYREYKSDPKVCASCPLLSVCTQSRNNQNILRLVVRKSPTGESTHYFFRYVKVEVSC